MSKSVQPLLIWMDAAVADGAILFSKRIPAGDTRALASHQRGPSLPRRLIGLLPMKRSETSGKGASLEVEASIDSHEEKQSVVLNWYDLKTFGGLRQETRLVSWESGSAIVDPRSSGALALFAFRPSRLSVRIWICRSEEEESALQSRIGPVEPGWGVLLVRDQPTPQMVPMSPTAEKVMARDGRRTTRRVSDVESLLKVAALKATEGSIDDRFLTARHAAVALVADASDSPTTRAEMSIQLMVAQIENLLGAGRQIVRGLQESRSAGHDRERGTIAVFDAIANHRLSKIVSALKPGCCVVSMQEGMDSASCNQLTSAGIRIVVPRPLWQLYPVAARRSLSDLVSLLEAS